MNETLKLLKEMTDGLMNRFTESARINADFAMEYIAEETYKVSSLYITLNLGMLSASSFIYSNVELNKVSRWFVPFILFSSFSIVIEMIIRKRSLRILRWGCNEKVSNVDTANKDLAETFSLYVNDPIKCTEKMKEVGTKFSNANNAVNITVNDYLSSYSSRRSVSEICILISVLSLVLVALSQLGILLPILQFYFRYSIWSFLVG